MLPSRADNIYIILILHIGEIDSRFFLHVQFHKCEAVREGLHTINLVHAYGPCKGKDFLRLQCHKTSGLRFPSKDP